MPDDHLQLRGAAFQCPRRAAGRRWRHIPFLIKPSGSKLRYGPSCAKHCRYTPAHQRTSAAVKSSTPNKKKKFAELARRNWTAGIAACDTYSMAGSVWCLATFCCGAIAAPITSRCQRYRRVPAAQPRQTGHRRMNATEENGAVALVERMS